MKRENDISRGVWGTKWMVDKELQDSPGLAFVRRWLSRYDFSSLEWVTLRRGTPRAWGANPIYGKCRPPRMTPSGLFRINCSINSRARYPAKIPSLPHFLLNDEDEAIVAIVALATNQYLGATGQVRASSKVVRLFPGPTSDAEPNDFMMTAVEAYRRSVTDGSGDAPVSAGWCVECGKKLSARGGPRSYCSGRCRSAYHNRLRSARISARRGQSVCEVCGAEFTPLRSDAKTCSPACRQKKYRQR